MTSELSISVNPGPSDAVKVAVIGGEMDETNIDTLKSQLQGILNDTAVKTLIFHLKDLDFINSKGIGYLVSVHTHMAKDKRRLMVAQAQEAVMDVMNLIGLTSIIPYHATLEEALAA